MNDAVGVRPFYCGTQYLDWQLNNCAGCRKAAPPGAAFDAVTCDIERALIAAAMGDGMVPLAVVGRMGRADGRYSWPCLEHDPPFKNVRPDGTVDPAVPRPAAGGEG